MTLKRLSLVLSVLLLLALAAGAGAFALIADGQRRLGAALEQREQTLALTHALQDDATPVAGAAPDTRARPRTFAQRMLALGFSPEEFNALARAYAAATALQQLRTATDLVTPDAAQLQSDLTAAVQDLRDRADRRTRARVDAAGQALQRDLLGGAAAFLLAVALAGLAGHLLRRHLLSPLRRLAQVTAAARRGEPGALAADATARAAAAHRSLQEAAQLADDLIHFARQAADAATLRHDLAEAQRAAGLAAQALRERDSAARDALADCQAQAAAAAAGAAEVHATLLRTHAAALATLQRDHAQATASLQQEQAVVLASLQQEGQQAVGTLQREHAASLDRLAAAHAAAAARQEERHAGALLALQHTHGTVLAELAAVLARPHDAASLRDLQQDLTALVRPDDALAAAPAQRLHAHQLAAAAVAQARVQAGALGRVRTFALAGDQEGAPGLALLGDEAGLRCLLRNLLAHAALTEPTGPVTLALELELADGDRADARYACLRATVRVVAAMPGQTGADGWEWRLASRLAARLGATLHGAEDPAGTLRWVLQLILPIAAPLADAPSDRDDAASTAAPLPVPAGATTAFVDWDTGCSHTGHNPERFRQVLQAFLHDCDGLDGLLTAQAGAADWEGARRTVHAFRGVAGTLGVHDTLLRLAAQVETACAEQQPAPAGAALEMLRPLLDALQRELRQWLATPVAGLRLPPAGSPAGILGNMIRPARPVLHRVAPSPARQALLQLRDLLADGDSAALDCWVAHARAAAISTFDSDQVERMVAALDRFAFAEALQVLEPGLGLTPTPPVEVLPPPAVQPAVVRRLAPEDLAAPAHLQAEARHA